MFADTWTFSEKAASPNAVSLPPTYKIKPLQEPNSAKYLLSCRDIPQRSWQRTDLPSPLELPPHEDPQELDWKGLWKEKKSKGYGDITLRGRCCISPQGQPNPLLTFTKDTELESKVLLPATRKVCSRGANVESKFEEVLNLAASQKPQDTHQPVWSLPYDAKGSYVHSS